MASAPLGSGRVPFNTDCLVTHAMPCGTHLTWDGDDLRRLLREAQIEAGHAKHYLTR